MCTTLIPLHLCFILIRLTTEGREEAEAGAGGVGDGDGRRAGGK